MPLAASAAVAAPPAGSRMAIRRRWSATVTCTSGAALVQRRRRERWDRRHRRRCRARRWRRRRSDWSIEHERLCGPRRRYRPPTRRSRLLGRRWGRWRWGHPAPFLAARRRSQLVLPRPRRLLLLPLAPAGCAAFGLIRLRRVGVCLCRRSSDLCSDGFERCRIGRRHLDRRRRRRLPNRRRHRRHFRGRRRHYGRELGQRV